MSATDSPVYIIELGETNLILARANLGQRPRLVEDIREVWLGDPAAVDAALAEVKTGSAPGKAIVLFRLKSRSQLLADNALGQRIKAASAVEDYLRESLGAENIPANWAWAAAKDGRPPENGTPWLIDATPTAQTDEALGKIKGWSFELLRCEPAALVLAGTLAGAARNAAGLTPILLCDVGETRSTLSVIAGQGITNLVTVPAGFDALAEATQGALGLKFRGSAARLLYNDSYDFADSASKIVEPLATAIRQALPSLGALTPASLVCSGILARQTWISQALASATGLKLFSFDAVAWAGANNLALGTAVKADSIAPTWLGALTALTSYEPRNPGAAAPWHPVLSNTPVAAAPFVPAIAIDPAPAPKPAAVVPPPAVKPSEPAKPVVAAKPVEPPPAAKPAVVITPPSKPAEPAKPVEPAKTATPPVAAKPAQATPAAKPLDPKAKAPEAKPAPVAPAKPSPAPTPAPKPAAKPEPAKPAPAPVSKPAPAPVAATPAGRTPTPAPFPKKKSSMVPVIMGVVILALLAGGGYMWMDGQKKEKARLAEAAERDRKAAEEAAARRKAEEQAKAEKDAREKLQEENRLKAIAAEEQRKRAEEEASRNTAARLLNARGSLIVATDPVGATIAVGELAPRPSPLNLKDLRLGRYSVTISLAGYDTATREVEIKENEVSDLGTVKLTRQVGGLEIASDPNGLNYEVKPAGALFVSSNDVRTGQTPATIGDLPVGAYQVTISRPNWGNYVTNVNVERNGSARVQGSFLAGIVVIKSNPSGATVLRDNQKEIGVTPLTLNDVVPGAVSFTLTQRGMDPVTVTGKAESGKTIELTGTLLDSDRVMKQTELDERPVNILIVEPELTPALQGDGGAVVISFVVGKDGVPGEIQIVSSPSPALGRVCLAAVAKWRFKPGTIKGKPVRVKVTQSLKIPPAS